MLLAAPSAIDIALAINLVNGPAIPGGYAVLAYSTITNSGDTVITGNLGLFPGSSVTGFPPGTVSGTQDITNTAANNGIIAGTAAYTTAQGLSGNELSASSYEFGGTTLPPGVYKVGSDATITGTFTLSGAGTYVFQIGASLTAESGSVVALTNGATAGNVLWVVGSSATLDTTATFNGTIIAQASVVLDTGASVNGNLIALTGEVTLEDNAVTGVAGTSGQSAQLIPIPIITGEQSPKFVQFNATAPFWFDGSSLPSVVASSTISTFTDSVPSHTSKYITAPMSWASLNGVAYLSIVSTTSQIIGLIFANDY